MTDVAARTDTDIAIRPSPHVVVVCAMAASIAAVGAGFIWPGAADALIRGLLVVLAVGVLAVLAGRAAQRVAAGLWRSPFDRDPSPPPPAEAPQQLRSITAELTAAADGRWARQTTIPHSARVTVRRDAGRRLAQNHGLSLRDPAHHPHIRRLVSAPTWTLIRPIDPKQPARLTYSGTEAVPLSELNRILDDLERL